MGFDATTARERAALRSAVDAGHLQREPNGHFSLLMAGRDRLREINSVIMPPAAQALASVERAIAATELEHAAARDTRACPICGAAAGAECAYGVSGRAQAGPERFPGRVHLRRLRAYLATLTAG